MIFRKLFLSIFLLTATLRLSSQSPEWQAAGMPLYGNEIKCIYTDTTNNILYVGGIIINSPTTWGNFYICSYNGDSWNTLGAFNNVVWSLSSYGGHLIVSGDFTEVNGNPIAYLAQYDGTAWSSMGNVDNVVRKLRVIDSDLYVLGGFDTVDGTPAKRIARWDGSTWHDVHGFSVETGDWLNDMTVYNGNIYVCGNFEDTTLGTRHLEVFKDGAWQQVGGGILGNWTQLFEMAVYKDELYVAGQILKSDGNVGHCIQKWNDTAWSEVGGSLQDYLGGYGFCGIRDLQIHNNELYAAGNFGYAGNVPATYIAKWNGLKWCGLASHDLFTTGAGAQSGSAIGFLNDTLYLGIANDTLNGIATNRILRYLGGNYTDTCSIEYTVIQNDIAEQNISIYPNPATTNITVEFELPAPENISIEIKNVLGQTVKSIPPKLFTTGSQKIEIDIDAFPPGVYFVQFQAASGAICRKIVKQ